MLAALSLFRKPVSMAEIGATAGMDRREAQRTIRDLENMKYVAVLQLENEDGGAAPSKYEILEEVAHGSGTVYREGGRQGLPRGGAADFDWALKPKTIRSVREGKYQGAKVNGKSHPTSRADRAADDRQRGIDSLRSAVMAARVAGTGSGSC
jgi:hypothetical protein